MSKWSQHYRTRLNSFESIQKYIEYKMSYKKKLLKYITEGLSGGSILEVGCGSGTTCTYLNSLGFKTTGIDIDDSMLSLATEIGLKYKSLPRFLKMDLLELDFPEEHFDVSFSNGVLEHFSDEEIIKSINDQLSIADKVIISVPTNYFNDHEKINGDERFLDYLSWEVIISKTEGEIFQLFGFHHKENSDYKFHEKIQLQLSPPPFLGIVLISKN